MVNIQFYCLLTNIIIKTKICESETTLFNFVNLPKREKAHLREKGLSQDMKYLPELYAFQGGSSRKHNSRNLTLSCDLDHFL